MSYHDAMEWLGRVDRHLVEGLLSVLEERRAETWRSQAACQDVPTAVFFPPRGSGVAAQQAASAVCDDCPVRDDCLDASRRHSHTLGIWAGQGERQRRLHQPATTEVA